MSNSVLDNLYAKIIKNFKQFDQLSNVITGGTNVFSHDVTVEKLVLDESWVNAIDTALRSIENIVRAPKKSIMEESLIVAVEKANRVNQRSIQHLANHSENIKYATKDEIMPTKVLTSIVEENLAIYENRFIITLLTKLNRFVDDRYKIIKKIVNVTCHDSVTLKSSFKLGRSRVNCHLGFDIKDMPDDDMNEKNATIITKVDSIRRRLSMIRKSEFFIMLKTAKPVFAPIVKTNILTKNVDYNNAYKLWVFMAGYSEEGFTLEVLHKNLPCSEDFCDDLVNALTTLTAVSVANHNLSREVFNKIPYRKVIERNYRVVTRFNYKPTFERKSITLQDDGINEFYYRKMRETLTKGTGVSRVTPNTIVQEKNISLPFSKFYRAVTKVSNELYKDVLRVDYRQSRKANPTKYDILKIDYDYQTQIVKRNHILSSLKAEEYERQLNFEAREELKLDKIKYQLDIAEQKSLDKRIDEYIRRNVSKKIKAKEKAVLTAAKKYRAKLKSTEAERQAKLEAERRAKQVATRKEERERKLLALLKLKYESNRDNSDVALNKELDIDIDNNIHGDDIISYIFDEATMPGAPDREDFDTDNDVQIQLERIYDQPSNNQPHSNSQTTTKVNTDSGYEK